MNANIHLVRVLFGQYPGLSRNKDLGSLNKDLGSFNKDPGSFNKDPGSFTCCLVDWASFTAVKWGLITNQVVRKSHKAPQGKMRFLLSNKVPL